MARRVVAMTVAAVIAGCSAADAKVLVRYSRSGGFAGVSESLVVRTSGSVRVSEGRAGEARRFSVSDARLHRLRHALRAARFSTLKARYAPDVVVNDGFTKSVTYRRRTVTVETGADPPERLTKLLRRLARLAERA